MSETPDGVITSWNAAAERLFGYHAAEAVGKHIHLIVPPDRREDEERILAQVRGGKAIDSYDTVRIDKDGRRIDISASISPVHDKAGRVIGAAKVARDITGQKKAEATVALLAAIVASSDDAIMSETPDGVITSWNAAAERLFGYSALEAVGHHIHLIVHPDRRADEERILGQVRGGKAIESYETVRIDKDGRRIDVSASISPVQDKTGRVVGAAKVARDITGQKKAEATVALLAAIVASSDDAIMSKTSDGIITSWNGAAERLFGYSAADAIGQHIHLIVPRDLWAEEESIAGQTRSGKATDHYDTVRVDKEGRRIDISAAVSPVLNKAGHVVGAAKVARDITGEKKAEATVALLAAIVASSDDAILSKTTDGIITSWNTAAETLFGYPAAEAIGQHVRLIVPPDLWEEEESINAQTRDGKSIQHFETVRVGKDGRRVDISASISPVHDKAGRVVGAAKVARDIKIRKLHEAELARHAEALERSNKELDDFAYIASHDLKEPLRGLFSNAKFLQEDYGDKLAEDGVNRLRRLGYLSQRMEQLVNDLLYFARLGRQDLAIQPTDLNAVIRDIEMMSETTLKERNVTLAVPQLLPQISCDKTRITEVFRNLIINAAKYNDNDAKLIEIGYLPSLVTSGGLEKDVFYVRDNGIGIAEEFHEDIFRIFKRLNAEDDDKKGTGVGLTFVRKIVERHGGRIWLESSHGEGTTFYFTIDQGPHHEAAA
jgi:PAS domain S-box-containing protein